jgi:nucleotide-binding universal stress UspA family protein
VRTKIETLLVGSSLRPESDALLRDALAMTRSLGARLRVAHAFEPAALYVGEPFAALGPDLQDYQERELRQELAAQMARVGVKKEELLGIDLGLGPAHQLLLGAAREADADLIVVGAAETSRGPRVLGSTADRVLRKATRPVLVLRPPLQLPLRRVLVPVDLSPLSADAYRFARRFLAQAAGASAPQIETLFVLPPFRRLPAPAAAVPADGPCAADELERFVAALGGTAGIGRRLRLGHPVDQVLGEIAQWSADLVILGTHGRSGYERFLLGSVAGRVAHEAPCSALVVPPEAALAAALADEAAALAGARVGA